MFKVSQNFENQNQDQSCQDPDCDQGIEIEHGEFYKGMQNNKSFLAQFIVKIAKILDALQEKNLVHGDINPENIMIKIEKGQV